MMLKTIPLYLFLIFCSTLVYAQSPETFVLKGNVKNLEANTFELELTGYFMTDSETIPTDAQGNFIKTISTDGVQDALIRFKSGEVLKFFVVPNDTIVLNWDENDPKKSLKISSPSKERNSELNLMGDYSKQRLSPFLDMMRELVKPEVTPQVKFKMINDSFNSDLALMKNRPRTKYGSKIIYDFYYKHISILARMGLLHPSALEVNSSLKSVLTAQGLSAQKLDYESLNEVSLYQSNTYRDFILTQMKKSRSFKEMSIRKMGLSAFPMLSDYYAQGQTINNPTIRDWYLARILFNALEMRDLVGVRPLYQQFLKECKTPAFASGLTVHYNKEEKRQARK